MRNSLGLLLRLGFWSVVIVVGLKFGQFSAKGVMYLTVAVAVAVQLCIAVIRDRRR